MLLTRLRAGIDPRRPFAPAMDRAKRFNWDAAARATRNVLDAVRESSLPLTANARVAGL
jgi:hypothetical protein